MKMDIKTNYEITDGLTAALVTDTDASTAALDLADGETAAFFLAATAVATTLDAILEFSADGSTGWTPAVDTENDLAITQLVAPGTAQINVVRKELQFCRLTGTSVDGSTFGITSVLGPLCSF